MLMTLTEQLSAHLKDAMRARDDVRLRTIRSLRSALQSAEIAQRQEGSATLSDEDVLAVLTRQAKQRRESIEQYKQAGRDDLREKEEQELAVIESYLPRQLSDDEIRAVIAEEASSAGATGPGDMGRVMGAAMARLRGQADGKRVQALVREHLNP